jgi:hypothetical protein
MTHVYHERGHETTCNVCGRVIEEDEPRWTPTDIMVKGSMCTECAEKERR